MSKYEVGDAPVKYVTVKSRDRCPKCRNYMSEKIPAPRYGQFKYEASKGRRHLASKYCSYCGYGSR